MKISRGRVVLLSGQRRRGYGRLFETPLSSVRYKYSNSMQMFDNFYFQTRLAWVSDNMPHCTWWCGCSLLSSSLSVSRERTSTALAWSGLLVVVYHDGAVMVLKSELHFTCHDHRFEYYLTTISVIKCLPMTKYVESLLLLNCLRYRNMNGIMLSQIVWVICF